jgi:hypothetical protein
VLGATQLIPKSKFVVPELLGLQVTPPFVVPTIVPPAPTAKHVVVVGQLMPVSPVPPPGDWTDQLTPPSVVAIDELPTT